MTHNHTNETWTKEDQQNSEPDFYGKWVRCDKELPCIGQAVMAISHDGGSQATPRIVCRLNTEYGWAWNNVGNELPVYAENQAYFNYWMQVPSPPNP